LTNLDKWYRRTRDIKVGDELMPPSGAARPGDAEEFDTVHARLLQFFPELVEQLGGDPAALVRLAGIDAASQAGGWAVTYRQAVELIELAATELRCADFGMRLATLQGGDMFGPLGIVMRNSGTFGHALDYVCTHTYAHSLAARVWLKRFPGAETLFVGHDILLDRLPNRSQAMEQLLLVGHLGALEITGGRARARRVHFRHQPISPPNVYRRYFGCEVFFGQDEDGIFFAEHDLASPIVEPDSTIYEATTSFIDRRFTRQSPPIHAQARGIVMQLLGTDQCRNERIAAELKLHPRTLHRRLRAEGTSVQAIKDEVRRDLMLYYVRQTDVPFAAISEKLGFAEQSVFTRSCNRWFALSPTQLRTQRSLPAG
jgi:AraC-like DNA-binding protein